MEWYQPDIPGLRLEDIEIVVGEADRPFRPIGPIVAHRSATTMFSKAPLLSEVNEVLRLEAARAGANGVVNVIYERGSTLTAWKMLTASGMAVVFHDDTQACPSCAETIKAAAKVCRFCGASVATGGDHEFSG